jgi:hypothetical protein
MRLKITPLRAIVALLVLTLIVGAGNLWASWAEVHAYKAAQKREQVEQQRAGALIEQRLCTTLGKLAALVPPPGNPKTNPSRAYDDDLHATLAQLGTDLGCK